MAKKIAVTALTGRTAEIPAPRYFATQAAWRAWLEKNHAKRNELWVGFHRVGTGKPSITWPQSVDEALCFGWIDGLRRGIDETRYAIRFTPRKATSIWSRVNVKRYGELERMGVVRAAGRAAFAKKTERRSGIYGHEQEEKVPDAGVEKVLKADARAWNWYAAQTPGYRWLASRWVTQAKREETRERRLATLIACCRKGEYIPPLVWTKKRPKPTGSRPRAPRQSGRAK